MREIRTYGSVGVPARKRRHYPAKSSGKSDLLALNFPACLFSQPVDQKLAEQATAEQAAVLVLVY